MGESEAASFLTCSQSLFETFFEPGMICLPFMFMSPAKTDYACFLSREPYNSKNREYLRNIGKGLAPDLAVADDLEYQTVTI